MMPPAESAAERKARKAAGTPRRDALEAALLRLLSGPLEHAGWDTCRRLGALGGLAFFHALQRRRAIAVANIQLAFPTLSERAATVIARRSAQNMGMTFCEFMRLRTATPAEITEYMDLSGMERVHQALTGGRGAVLITAHLGNWEMLAARIAQEVPITVVARPSSNRGLEQHINRVREQTGLKVLSKYATARATLTTLRANGVLGLLPDQHAGPGGLLLPFFGRPTRVIDAVARMSQLSGAPVLAAFGVRRTPWLAWGRLEGEFLPALPPVPRDGDREGAVREATRTHLALMEDVIRRYPDQWLWMHRRWRQDDVDGDSAAPGVSTSPEQTEREPGGATPRHGGRTVAED